jgi:hypothetical protein
VGQKGHGKSRGLYFFLWKRKGNHQLGAGYFVQQVREWDLLRKVCHIFLYERSLV